MSRIERTPGGCWLWTGSTTYKGYAQVMGTVDGVTERRGHRLAWMLAHGPIPDGAQIDHICHDASCPTPGDSDSHRRCMNPDHLRLVTQAENQAADRIVPSRYNARKTHCPAGHPYSGQNLYVAPSGGRMCRTCLRSRYRTQNEKRKQRRKAA